MPRRIGINAAFLDPARMGGAETYTRRLIHELQTLDVTHDFVVFVPRFHDLTFSHPRFEPVLCPVDASHRKRRILWEQAALPGILARHRLDLVHFPYGTMPLRYHGASVATIHDTVRFHFPDVMPRAERWYRAIVERHLARCGAHMISVSRWHGDDIARSLRIDRGRIETVYHGVSPEFLAARHDVPPDRPYLLWVGRPFPPQRNLETLLSALRLLRRQAAETPILRIVGVGPRDEARVRQMVAREGVGQLVTVEPPMSHEELASLLAGAELYCCPSRHESFGLPVLEALASGAAVVAADIPVFRELYGDAVRYADPSSPQSFAQAIAALLSDDVARSDLRQRGKDRARGFTWRACAEATCAIYRRLLESRGE